MDITKRIENFAEWYQDVIRAADLADNSPVRGCMVIKPYGYSIWENIQSILDKRMKKIGVKNAYFPMLIPLEFISKEAEHIDGFAKECAIVTHTRLSQSSDGSGLVLDGELDRPYVIRPTSEAIIGHTISNWINTYRDLPLKLNQWCNVMRWEMRPRIFLRTSEFLWQEGHTVFTTEDEARADAQTMLELYRNFILNDLCFCIVSGEKTDDEKFPGAVNTYTVEAIMQDGKALQAATSHYLGQSFSKAFDIKYSNKENQQSFAHTASWGVSTRLIGGIVMSHGDDDGIILPPAIAPYQVVIIPIIKSEEHKSNILDTCRRINSKIEDLGIRSFVDDSDDSVPNKVWGWIRKGAPIRIEIGQREVESGEMSINRRDKDRKAKITVKLENLIALDEILLDISMEMRSKMKDRKKEMIRFVDDIKSIEEIFNEGYNGLIGIRNIGIESDEFQIISEKYSISKRCIYKDGNDSYLLMGKAY